MTSDDLIKRLESAQETDLVPESDKTESERFFVFSVGQNLYALPPASIHEIVASSDIFPIPACPPYIPGLINCHGIPHTVFDLRVLFSNERLPTEQFLILNLENDAVAFGCTEVKEITDYPVSCISRFAEKESESLFFTSIIETGESKIPVISIRHVLQKLVNDFA